MLPPSSAAFAALLALLLRRVSAQSDGANYRSFQPASMACGAKPENVVEGGSDVMYGNDYSCDSMLPPSTWQKQSDGADYDLAIIGGGIGGAYLVNRLYEEFSKKNQEPPKIALFERAHTVGGRLMSSFGTGALGLAVQPRTKSNEPGTLAMPQTLQEYGGMRIDPYRHPLLFNKVIEEGQDLFGKDRCKSVEECRIGDVCCPDMITRMEVGGVRYATTLADQGILSDSNVSMQSELYRVTPEGRVVSSYSLQNIAEGLGTPFDKCMQLVVAAQKYYPRDAPNFKTLLFTTAMRDMCTNCDVLQGGVTPGIEGLCELCEQFPDPAAAVISCSGYDVDVDSNTLPTIIDFVDEVLNVKRETNLHLLRAGFQRLVMGLLRRNGELGIAPYVTKTFTGLSLGSGADIASLAQAQTERLTEPEQYNTTPSADIVTLNFADGSSTTAKSVYMGMLPFDLPAIEGFGAWDSVMEKVHIPDLASKLVLGWKDASKALPHLLGMQPCVPGPCQRLILDGDQGKGWMVRQLWLWDRFSVMIYDSGPAAGNFTSPAKTTIETANEKGMEALVSSYMEQIRNATGLEVEDPDYARLKSWPGGNLLSWDDIHIEKELNSTAKQVAAHTSRPLGYDVPVYYGNSEMAPDGADHGWAEGALWMVEDSLPSLAAYLGLEGDVEIPQREKINITGAMQELQDAHDAGTLEDSATGEDLDPVDQPAGTAPPSSVASPYVAAGGMMSLLPLLLLFIVL